MNKTLLAIWSGLVAIGLTAFFLFGTINLVAKGGTALEGIGVMFTAVFILVPQWVNFSKNMDNSV